MSKSKRVLKHEEEEESKVGTNYCCSKRKTEDKNQEQGLAYDLFEKSAGLAEKGNSSIQVSYTLCKIHVNAGSKDSIDFH